MPVGIRIMTDREKYIPLADRALPEGVLRRVFILRPPTHDEAAQIVNFMQPEVNPANGYARFAKGTLASYCVRQCLVGWENVRTVAGAPVAFTGAREGDGTPCAHRDDLDKLQWKDVEELAERVQALMEAPPALLT